jgi:hypothetical protein
MGEEMNRGSPRRCLCRQGSPPASLEQRSDDLAFGVQGAREIRVGEGTGTIWIERSRVSGLSGGKLTVISPRHSRIAGSVRYRSRP